MTPIAFLFYLLTVAGIAGFVLWAARRETPPRVRTLLGAFFGLLVLGCLGMASPVLAIGGPLAAAGVGIARWRGVSARRCVTFGLAAIAAGCAADAAGFYAFRYRPFAAWVAAARERYPPIPRSDRLPQPPPVTVEQPAPHPGRPRFNERFASPDLEIASGEWRRAWTLRSLHSAHTDFATRFALRPEFGPLRMVALNHGLEPADLSRPRPAILPQPSDRWLAPDAALAEPSALAAAEELRGELAPWHADRGIDFANPGGFGLLGEPDAPPFQAAGLPADADPALAPYLIGFEPHAAGTPPGDPLAPAWRLARVELIGLVAGPDPVAYASAELPRMGETASHITRSLTDFERAALPRLAAGEWVVAGADGDRLRAVGALPAANACAECHGVEEGRLLGALSYEFARPPPPDPGGVAAAGAGR